MEIHLRYPAERQTNKQVDFSKCDVVPKVLYLGFYFWGKLRDPLCCNTILIAPCVTLNILKLTLAFNEKAEEK